MMIDPFTAVESSTVPAKGVGYVYYAKKEDAIMIK
jgi:hypothetical protein